MSRALHAEERPFANEVIEECIDIIEFVDAASEWGSVVRIPAQEAKRMEYLANARRIAE